MLAVRQAAQAAAGLEAVDPAHLHVQQQQVERGLLQGGQGRFARVDLGHVETRVAQRAPGHVTQQQVVVDHQQTGLRVVGGHQRGFG